MARLTVTRAQLVEALRAQTGAASFCSIIACTIPPMNKTNNPYHGRCRKIARVNGIINWRYENAVNNQRVREEKAADFEALPRSWGTRLQGEPFVQHNEKLYIELKVSASVEHYYETHDGLRLDTATVESYLRERRPQTRQGLEREVILRDYALDSIRELHAYGNEYVIVEDAPTSGSGQ